VLLALHQLDPVVDQVGVEVLDLLLGQLDVLEALDDLVVVQEALLEAVLDELLKLFDFRESDIDGEQLSLGFLAQLAGCRWRPTCDAKEPGNLSPRLT
jgi:hypothetical protein